MPLTLAGPQPGTTVPNPDATPVIGGVNPGGAPWVLDESSRVRLRENGRITVRVEDLVIPGVDGAADRNPVGLMVASLVCGTTVVDSTDPFGPGEGLFTKEFYGSCYNALREDGIMVNQHESPFYAADAAAMQRAHKRIVECFPISRVYQAHIPTYPSGHWLFGFASKKYHPVTDCNPTAWTLLGLSTRYYNAKLHRSAFSLPTYVEELLRDVEPQ